MSQLLSTNESATLKTLDIPFSYFMLPMWAVYIAVVPGCTWLRVYFPGCDWFVMEFDNETNIEIRHRALISPDTI